jgi:hypothetical protein
MNILHTFHDGSTLHKMSAKELIKLNIWKGNRILDRKHVDEIKGSVGNAVKRLDSGYRIIQYKELSADDRPILSSYLIDGQHRLTVLKEFFEGSVCEEDFDVIVIKKKVDCEEDAIEYFNQLNNVKPQSWKTDHVQVANKYILALSAKLNTKTRKVIRSGRTQRPYLSADKLRDELLLYKDKLEWNTEKVERFVAFAVNFNTEEIERLNIQNGYGTGSKFTEKAVELEFALGLDLNWVKKYFE